MRKTLAVVGILIGLLWLAFSPTVWMYLRKVGMQPRSYQTEQWVNEYMSTREARVNSLRCETPNHTLGDQVRLRICFFKGKLIEVEKLVIEGCHIPLKSVVECGGLRQFLDICRQENRVHVMDRSGPEKLISLLPISSDFRGYVLDGNKPNRQQGCAVGSSLPSAILFDPASERGAFVWGQSAG